MRVCMIVHAYYVRDARVRRYAEALVQAGHEVDVIGLREPNAPRRQTVEGVKLYSLPPQRARGGALRYIYEYSLFLLLAALKVSWLHLRRPYDLVHVHNMPDVLVFAALVPRLLGAKVILDAHDLMPEVYQSKFKATQQHPVIRLLVGLERLSHRFAHHVIFANELFRQTCIGRGTPERKTSVVLNSADLRIFGGRSAAGPARRNGTLHLLYVGTISERHGVDFALRGLAALCGELPGLRLEIVPKFAEGEGDDLRRLNETIARLSLQEQVSIGEPVPLEQMPAVMARADVGLFTPRVDIHIDSALSLKVPEYVAMGLPIVTTRTRIMELYFDDSQVMYFADGDLAGFCDAIRKLYADRALASQLAQNARRFLEEHSWDAERARYFDTVSRLTGIPVTSS